MDRLEGYALLHGKVAVVTGGGQGIGYAIAEVLGRNGASVVIADIDESSAESAALRLERSGYSVVGRRCDVTSELDMNDVVQLAVGSFGRIDVMVNNAGITRDAVMRKMSLDDFKTVIDVHLTGTWLGTKLAGAVMRKSGSGSIINISSISGKVGNVGQTNYSAAKAGIVGLTKAAAKEMGRYGVRVNAIQPGLIRTAMTAAMPKEAWESKASDIPLGRAGEPQEIADVALFLASELSRYMTGTVLEVTGGRHM